jgi:hypothetical protein
MTERTEQARARCESCNKAYRVPDAARTYSCKACGGVIRAETDGDGEGEHHLSGAVTCPECHAVNHHGAHFCDECGSVLQPSKPRHKGEDAMRARLDATRELKRGYGWLAAVTYLFRGGTAAYGAITVVAVVALGSAEVPRDPGLLVVGISCVLTTLMLMGSLQLLFAPFRWTIAIASLATVVSICHLVGPNPLGLTFFWAAGWALAFWIAVVPAQRFRRLIDRHEDLYILHHASRQTKRSIEGRSAKDSHERLLRAKSRAARRAWKASSVAGSVFVVATALASFLIMDNVRPQELSTARSEFESAWSRADFAAIESLFMKEIRSNQGQRLARIAEGHEWNRGLPALLELGKQVDKGDARIDYEALGVEVSANWTLDKRVWRLVSLDFPVPPFEQAVALFRQAWATSDPGAIAAFFPPSYQEERRASIETVVERRRWSSFPPLGEVEITAPNDEEAAAVFSSDGFDVVTDWRFRANGLWGLHSIQFPKHQ